MSTVNNVVAINTANEDIFFRYWLQFLKPLHGLTDREVEVASHLLKHRYNLSKVINDQEVLDSTFLSDDVRKRIIEDCGITKAHFQVILTNLRRNKVLDGNSINPKFIPKIDEGSKSFQLLFYFTAPWIGEDV